MKTKNQMKPLARLIATSLAVGSMAGFGTQVLAQTAAGTLIKNLATVTYEDANGNEYSAQSNEAVVTVAPVYFATLVNDNTLSGAPGNIVYFPHTLSNTGNIADTYTVAATAGTVYLDENNNGQPDPGETKVDDPVTVAAGEQVSLVVALPIPEDTTVASLDSKLTVTSNAEDAAGNPIGNVKDDGANFDAATDTAVASATNDNKALVTSGPVLVLNKSSVHDVTNQQITYTLTVKNTGGSTADNVIIEDILPLVDHDGDNDPSDLKQIELVDGSISTSGLVNQNDVEGAAGTVTVAGDVLNSIVATDMNLPPNTTVSVTYTVSYDKDDTLDTLEWAAGENVDNTFTAVFDYDVTDSAGVTTTVEDVSVSSNTTNDVIPKIYDVDALDTNILGAVDSDGDLIPATNDGGDDDATATSTANDIQYVDVSPTGGEVKFKHVITNTGNGDDTFNLDVASADIAAKSPSDTWTLDAGSIDFPPNTVFTFWNEAGTVQLTDTDNDGVPDTGTLSQDESLAIMVKAKLPAGYSDINSAVSDPSYNAMLTATSSGDTDKENTTLLKLGKITAPSVDIANADLTTGQGMVGFEDGGDQNAQNESPVKLINAEVGSVAVFALILANESGSADSYLLSASNVPAGWDVTFKDKAGNVITTTPLMPGLGAPFEYDAFVTISADPSEARSNSDRADDVDGYDDSNTDTSNSLVDGTIDAGNDGTTDKPDKDYQINFTATSTSTKLLSDTVTNSVDVMPNREVVITPNGQNQIQPGGTVDYSHKIENNGNLDEPVEVAVSNTRADEGWTTVIKVDTTGDGIPDAILVPGTDTIKGVNPDGTYVDIAVVYVGGNAQMVIPPGVDVPLISVVNSPSNAPLGTVDSSVVSVSDNTDTTANPGHVLSPTVTAQDQTSVILGQVRLDKKAAIDTNCDGKPDPVTLPSVMYSANQTAQVKPGECVVWRLTATNEGNARVQNVVISDAAPDYTTLLPDVLKLCLGNGVDCDEEPLLNTKLVDDLDHVTGDVVTFTPLNTIDINGVTYGDYLMPGEKLTAEFTVKVD